MKTIEDFIQNLSDYDIDLADKLENLKEAGQISRTVYKLVHTRDNFETIEHFIGEILQDDIGDSEFTNAQIKSICDETKFLHRENLISKADDFASGLYNCDDIYLYAISDVLDIDMSELEFYESEVM